jgi:hypothetical protein
VEFGKKRREEMKGRKMTLMVDGKYKAIYGSGIHELGINRDLDMHRPDCDEEE